MTRWQAEAWVRAVTWEVTFNPDRFYTSRWCGSAWDAQRAVTTTVWASSEARARRKLERRIVKLRRVASAILTEGSTGVVASVK